jgi:hypothetical protein
MLPYRIDEVISEIAEKLARGFMLYKAKYQPAISAGVGIEFQGTIYKGEHEAIIEIDLWQKVRDTLRRNGITGGKDVRNKHGALLKGLLFCEPCGTSMGHAYTPRKRKIYRYYVCLNAQQRGWDTCPTKSINAHDIEQAVIQHIRGIGSNEAVLEQTVAKSGLKSTNGFPSWRPNSLLANGRSSV